MNYTRLLLRIKDSAFLFKTAESPSLYNGICTFYCQDACAVKKQKKKKKKGAMKITMKKVYSG